MKHSFRMIANAASAAFDMAGTMTQSPRTISMTSAVNNSEVMATK